jgi:hypothetical protein
MEAKKLLAAFAQAGKRTHLVGTLSAGVIVALDMEGRLFTVQENKVLNRVNPAAIAGQSNRELYLNPGGDGLWPAPEGTTLGYQYAAGGWRVSPGLRAIRYAVIASGGDSATITGEVDLINNKGQGVPAIFKRRIKVAPVAGGVTVQVRESITYIGSATLRNTACLLAPWTLCQLDSGPGCAVVFPCPDATVVTDLYEEDSSSQRTFRKGRCVTKADGAMRYQIALDHRVPWIEFTDPRRGLTVRRSSGSIQEGQSFIDIRDAGPEVRPSKTGARYSVYSDTAGFMEIEAVGGCPESLAPDTEMSILITTRYRTSR